MVGDVGFYIYQQVYPFYAFALILSTYGFPVIISKLLSEIKEEKSDYTRTDIVVTSWFSLSVIGLTLFSFLFFGADFIAQFMDDPMLSKSLKLISFSFLFMPIVSILKGLFQSNGEMVPTAVSQVVEQAVRVGCILLFAWIFLRYELSLYEVAEGAFIGSVLGSAVSGIILLCFYFFKKNSEKISFDSLNMRRNVWPLSRSIIGQGILFGVSSLILVFIQFMDALTLYPMLINSGIESLDAKQWKGIYDRGQPLLHLGTAVTIPLSLTIVPLISKFKQKDDIQQIGYYTELSFRLSLMLGMAAAVGLFWIIKPVNIMLFTDAKGSEELAVLVLSILFCSLLMTGIFILQSLGHSKVAIGIICMGLTLKLFLMVILIPKLHIMGAAISTTSAFVLMACILFIYMRKVIGRSIIKRKTIILTLIASTVMTLLLITEKSLFDMMNHYYTTNRVVSLFEVLFSVSTVAFVYIFIIIRYGMFTLDELALLPFGSKLAKFLPKKN